MGRGHGTQLSWVVVGAAISITTPLAHAEDITISTYYPSPRGVYQELRTTNNTYLATQAGNVGIGTIGPLSKLDVNGGVAIGTYAGINAAPGNGVIVSGSVGIGTTAPGGTLSIVSPNTTGTNADASINLSSTVTTGHAIYSEANNLTTGLNLYTYSQANATSAGPVAANQFQLNAIPSSASSSTFAAVTGYAGSTSVNVNGGIVGVYGQALPQNASGILATSIGVSGYTEHDAAGTVTWMRGLQGQYGITAGTITNGAGLYIANPGSGGGAITNNYGLYVEPQTTGVNNYAAVFAGGNVGIGTTAPTAAKLVVAGEVGFGNTASTCDAVTEGQQRYNATSHQMEFCNGTAWSVYSGGGFSNMQRFISSGTFTVPPGITKVKVTVVGGGGGGGSYCGGGGGGGGTAIRVISGLTPGANIAVTVGLGAAATPVLVGGGPGSPSSFGAYASASGGAGGASYNATGTTAVGGAGGIGASGDLNIRGQAGTDGLYQPFAPQPNTTLSPSFGGAGGSSSMGGGGVGGTGITDPVTAAPAPVLATAGGAYGGGGGGAPYGPSYTGGAGANGVVVVEY